MNEAAPARAAVMTTFEFIVYPFKKFPSKITDFPLVGEGKPRSIMPADIEIKIPEKFEEYKKKLGVKK